jgi:DNA-binding NarL/FixJ family response regulator
MRNILLLEDDAGTRQWFSELLHSIFSDITIVEAETIQKATALLEASDFSLAIIDIYLSDGQSFDFITRAKKYGKNLYCVVVTAFDDDTDIYTALKAGADGYLLKSQDKQKLAESLKEIMNGAPPLSPAIARRIMAHFREDQETTAGQETVLTKREQDVLTLIARGMTRIEVARILQIQEGTVAGYIKRLYAKLKVGSRAEAALEARRLGLI